MAITVSDIEQKEFTYKGPGYDPYDVDQYLDQICDEMVAMQEKIDRLEEDLAKARREVEAASNAVQPVAPVMVKTEEPTPVAKTSQTLESILISAQKLADGAVEDAKRKAQDIEKQAQTRADEILKTTQDEKDALQKGMETLRTAAVEYRKSFLELVDQQKELLEGKLSLFEGQDE